MEIKNQLFTKKTLEVNKLQNRDIQFLASSQGEFIVNWGNDFLKARTIILCHINGESKICIGRLGGNPFNSDPNFNEVFTLLIDRRNEKVSLHINSGNYNVTHSIEKNAPKTEEKLLLYIEGSLSAELIIFDGSTGQKITEIIVDKENKNMLKYTAIGCLEPYFPHLFR